MKTTSKPKASAGSGKKNTAKTVDEKKRQSAASKQQALPVKEKREPLGIAPYIVVAVAIFILISFFLPDTGIIGPFVKDVVLGLFGGGGYIVPFYMIFLAAFRKRDRENGVANAKIGFAVGSFLSILIIIQLFSPAPEAEEGVGFLKNLYVNGIALKGAGAVGSAVGIGLEKLIGHVASAIFSIFMAVILLIFLFGSTPRKVLRGAVNWFNDVFGAMRKDDEPEEETDRAPAVKKPVVKEEKKSEKPVKASRKAITSIPDDVVNAGEDVGDSVMQNESDEKTVTEINRDKPFADDEINGEYKQIFEEKDDKNDFDGLDTVSGNFEDAAETQIPADVLMPFTNEESPLVTEVSHVDAVSDNTVDEDDEPPFALSDEYVKPEPEYKPEIPTEELTKHTNEPLEAITADLPISDEQPYVFPPISLLQEDTEANAEESYDVIVETGRKLISVLESYGVKAKLVSTSRGPAVTRYEVLPDAGVRVNKISNLSEDIRMRMAATSIRIETNIPGKAAIGIEIPNKNPAIVRLRTLIDNPIFRDNKSKLFVCLGVDVGGNPVYFDIPDMPHLLIAGATGMGKSVCINSIIMSLLYRAKPDEVKLILIDPKKIELATYNDIPHLSVPVVTEPRKAAGSLNWAVVEMEKRYTLMQEVGDARNLKEYNNMIEGDPEREKLPYIVIVIDELADLIMSAPDEVETSICRLAQKARAAGIYLIIGTQRPTVDVITGLIKANVPSRIAFTVQSQIDSRTIIDTSGAEKLCGKGDMLFAPVKALKPIRVQGSFVDGTEVASVCTFVRNAAKATYDEEVIKQIEAEAKLCGLKPSQRAKEEAAAAGGGDEKEDALFLDAIGVAFEFGTMSTSLLQRKLSVGYSRAQKMIDMMEARGYVGKFDTQTKKRKINITLEEYQALRINKESEQ